MEKQGNWNTLCTRIGYFFKDSKLLFESFSHPSVVTLGGKMKSYQRMEWLGDGIVYFLATMKLFFKFPEASEKQLTNYRRLLVCNAYLAHIARGLELGSYLQMRPSASKDGLRQDDAVLACALEALVGAVYVDCGGLYLPVQHLTEQFVFADMDNTLNPASLKSFDPKGFMQELAQRKFKLDPQYRVLTDNGPKQDGVWTIGVFIGGNKIGEGQDKNQHIATKAAATNVLTATRDLTANLPFALLRGRQVFDELEIGRGRYEP